MATLLGPLTGTSVAVSLQNVSKAYRHFKLDKIHLEIPRGTVCRVDWSQCCGKIDNDAIMMGLDRGRVIASSNRDDFLDR